MERLGAQVQETGEPVQLNPMNPFERKVCHDKAAEMGLYSESEGMAPNRYVVLSLDEGDDEEDFGDEPLDDFDNADEAADDSADDALDSDEAVLDEDSDTSADEA